MEAGWQPREREDDFFRILAREETRRELVQDIGLTGIVYGPWSSYTYTEFRDKVPPEFKLRNYPDLCHCVGCEFPQQGWPVALALTHGREPISVRPQMFWAMLDQGEQCTDVLGCYSEGVSDDVNKFVALIAAWEGCGGGEGGGRGAEAAAASSCFLEESGLFDLGGDATELRKTKPALFEGLLEYCRFLCFLWDAEVAEKMCTLLFDLERKDWLESKKTDGIFAPAPTASTSAGTSTTGTSSSSRTRTSTTFRDFEDVVRPFLDKAPRTTLVLNWRMSMLKLRVYYDELVCRRAAAMLNYKQDHHINIKQHDRLLSVASEASSTTASGVSSTTSYGSETSRTTSSSCTFTEKPLPVSRTELTGKSWRKQATALAGEDLVGGEVVRTNKSRTAEDVVLTGEVVVEEEEDHRKFSNSLYTGTIIPTAEDRLHSANALYAEVLALSYLLYAQIGYQTSVVLGGQHRQRGAFADLFWTGGVFYNADKNPSLILATHPDCTCHAYLSVGENWENFALFDLSKTTAGRSSTRIISSTSNSRTNGGSTTASMIQFAGAGNSNSSSKNREGLTPVFVVPPRTSTNCSGGNSKNSSAAAPSTTLSTTHDSVRNAIVDQMYYSMTYETIASDHDKIAAQLLPRLRHSCLRWGSIVWPTARALFCLDLEQITFAAGRAAASRDGPTAATTSVDNRAPGEEVSNKKGIMPKTSLSLAITYIGKDAITLGGDWEELGRDTLPTRCVLKRVGAAGRKNDQKTTGSSADNSGQQVLEDHEEQLEVVSILHDFLELETTTTITCKLPDSIFEDEINQSDDIGSKKQFLIEMEVKNTKDISFCAIPMPIAEIAVVEVVGASDNSMIVKKISSKM
ncbi:unnamed protein product [Amoebophrya sp. A120]|nr:unnamed protein product [Amoebophrya sp. A120]|eukprot:GSA120T00008858001.1